MQLAAYTTFKLGGPCAHFSDCRTSEELVAAVQETRAAGTPFVLLGGGSNVLISDQGYRGRVIRYCQPDLRPCYVAASNCIEVSAAASLDATAAWLAEQGLEGLNFCSGIPGTIGGAIVGNAGAWGKEIGPDTVIEVCLLRRDGQVVTQPAKALGFSYRNSSLKTSGDIVLTARLRVRPGAAAALQQERMDRLKQRAEKHPDLSTHPCIGSIFKNIEPSSAVERRQAAGFFLEQAGAKTLRVGGAYVFPRHANIITIAPGASAEDVYQLHRLMKQAVTDTCGLELEREVRFLGSFGGAEAPPGYF